MTPPPQTPDALQAAAHALARQLYAGDVGGSCYHGEQHTCFMRQGRKPIALYKAEEMCERCQATWHALMTATLLDSLVVGQRFMAQTAAAAAVNGSNEPSCGKCGRRFKRKNHAAMHERHCKGVEEER